MKTQSELKGIANVYPIPERWAERSEPLWKNHPSLEHIGFHGVSLLGEDSDNSSACRKIHELFSMRFWRSPWMVEEIGSL